MPIPPSSLLIATARRRYEILKSAPRIPTMKPVASMLSIARGGPAASQPFDYPAFIDRISNAICGAWNLWRQSAALVDVQINAVTATGGTVTGPQLSPLILAQASPQGDEAAKLAQVIASALGTAWQQVTGSMKAPGFAMVSGIRCYAVAGGTADAEHADAGCGVDNGYRSNQQKCSQSRDALIGVQCFHRAPQRLRISSGSV